MSRVIDKLAELTGHRDRDVLDVTLAGALMDLLRPRGVAVYRCVGHDDDRRWHSRARLRRGEVAPAADALWVDPETLPPLHAAPDRLACLKRRKAVMRAGPPAMAYFALDATGDDTGVVEIETGSTLSAADAHMVVSILRIYRNFHALLDYSERDTLTGLLNRKTFDDGFLRLAAEIGRAGACPDGDLDGRRQAPPGSGWLGVIDIDHFKRVNDTHGHLIGDEVLLLLSRLMRGSFRYHDQLYRFGGEEFVVLMRCQGADNAAAAFERLRAAVEAYAFPRVGQVTVSIGFATLRAGDTPAEAFERADKAVYHAKQNGRNRVADFAALVAAGELEEQTRVSDLELF